MRESVDAEEQKSRLSHARDSANEETCGPTKDPGRTKKESPNESSPNENQDRGNDGGRGVVGD